MARRYVRKIKKAVNNTHGLTIFFVVLFFALGAVAGFFGYKYVTKTDTFEVVGDKEITLTVGDTYTELGAKAIAFGKDVQDKIVIDGTVDTATEGSYVITYTVSNLKYKDVKRVRVVNVVVGG